LRLQPHLEGGPLSAAKFLSELLFMPHAVIFEKIFFGGAANAFEGFPYLRVNVGVH
jgi:hypothetical protein